MKRSWGSTPLNLVEDGPVVFENRERTFEKTGTDERDGRTARSLSAYMKIAKKHKEMFTYKWAKIGSRNRNRTRERAPENQEGHLHEMLWEKPKLPVPWFRLGSLVEEEPQQTDQSAIH